MSPRPLTGPVLRNVVWQQGFPFTSPSSHGEWWCGLARALAVGAALAPQPVVYEPAVLRALHEQDGGLARAVMRTAGGWNEAPHDDTDFHHVLHAWWHGHLDASPGDEDHWVAARTGSFGRGRTQVDVAHCKDCGLPVYTVGHDYRLHHDPDDAEGWRRIWPHVGGGQ